MSVHATGRNLHVDVPLSNVVVGRRPPGFIADQFIPITPVDKQSNTYWKFNVGDNMRLEPGLTYRAPSTEARKVHMNVSSDGYYCKNYALGTDWPVEDEVNADSILRWAEANATMLTDRLMTDYEYRIAGVCANSSNVSTVTQVGCAWTLGQAPIVTQMLGYVETFRQRTGFVPNTLIVPFNLNQYISTNSQLCGILFGDKGGLATVQMLAEKLGVERVLQPLSQVNTANEINTNIGSWSRADIWGSDSIWLAHTKTLAGMYTDTWLNAFRWTSPALGTPFAVERFPYDPRRKCYDLSVGYYQDEKVVSQDLAVRIIVKSN